jgi:signal transduction histidine kinase
VVIALVAERLPAGLDPTLAPPEALGRPHLYDHPVLVALQFLLAFLYAAAAVGFTRRAERTGDELLGWFAVGSALASLASFYTGDVIRLLSNLVLLAGAAREIGRYWRGLATIAVLEERRRIAWDLHDGLAQELAFILRRAKRAGEGDAIAVQVAGAAERALADARRAVAALTRPLDEPLDFALAQAVEEVADRFGQKLDLDLQPNVHVDPLIREDLVRIAREAVANAARHGRAPTVRVELSNRSRLRLTIADDGAGFQPHTANRHERFGLVSMQERAHALHADFHLTSTPGGGTQIQVTLP